MEVLRRYLLALAGVIGALALTLSVPILRERFTFFAFWPLIFTAAFVGGRGPGIFVTALSTMCVIAVVPAEQRRSPYAIGFTVVAFMIGGAMAAVLARWRETTEAQLRDAVAQADRAVREARAAGQAKDAFLATVSHELRTPLSPILAWVTMLRSEDLPREQIERALEVIERNARMQAQLIEDLLDVSRIVEGKMRLQVRPVPLAAVVQNAVETVRPAAQAKGIQLQVVLDTSPCLVSGDPDRLQQIVWNLLSNAVKFTDKGGRVHVVLERSESQVEIVVSDTGCGISPELLPHLFERFWQADVSTDRVYGGLGLGLSIVRHLTELHGGTVLAHSPGSDHGSTFTVRLPLIPLASASSDQARRHPAAAESTQIPAISLAGLDVLVVDDDPDSNEVVRVMLANRGAEVRVAASVAQAMDELSRRAADVLVCDVGMPIEDGYALIHKVRTGPETICRIPAIALTAYASVDDRIRLLSAGFQVHVGKPADRDELAAAVAAVTGRVVQAQAEMDATG